MRFKLLTICALVVFSAFSLFQRTDAQETSSHEILGGYVNYTSDHQRQYLNEIISINTEDPEWNILPSPFKEHYDDWGEVVAGTWVENEFYAVTNLVKVGAYYVGHYIAYEPLTQNYRFIDESAGVLASSAIDMAYNYVTGELFAITGSNALIKLSLTDSSSILIGNITLDGIEMQNEPFRTLACDEDGILYGINDNGMIYTINPKNAQATYASTLDIPVGVYRQSATFSRKTGKMYWTNSGSATTLYEVDITTGTTEEITETPGIAGLFVLEYQDGAPYPAMSDIRIVKNPSDYTEATLIYTVPANDLMNLPISEKVDVEIWKGSNEKDIELIGTVSDLNAGQTYTYTLNETSGTYYYALRAKNKKSGHFSAFNGTYCSFFDIRFPYHTSFEADEENGSFFGLGEGWKAYTNTEEYTLVKTGERAFGVSEDTISKLCLTGLNIYEGVEYKITVPAVGYNVFWDYVMSTQWYEKPEKPLEITIGDEVFELTLKDENKEYKTYHDTSFVFTAKETGLLNIFFRATGLDDAYFLDDITIEQVSEIHFPAPVSDLALKENKPAELTATIEFTTPSTTADGNPLERFSGVYVQYSHTPNFMDETGQPDFFCDTLTVEKDKTLTHTIQFPENGYYHIRVYAFNTAGTSTASPLLSTGYMGDLVDYTFLAKDKEGQSLLADSAYLLPLFAESENRIDATSISQTEGIQFKQMEAGTYQLFAYAYGYAPYRQNVDIHENGQMDIVMNEVSLHRQPLMVENLKVKEINHEDLSLLIEWTNPSLDKDGNPLQSLDKVILEAFVPETSVSVETTAERLTIGGLSQATINLEKQGFYRLYATAHNEFGSSEKQEIEIGYVGNGYQVTFVCTDAEGKDLQATVSLFSEKNSVTLDPEENESMTSLVQGDTYTIYATADYHNRLIVEKCHIDSDTTIRLNTFEYAFQKPQVLTLEQEDKNAVMTWENTGSKNFNDSFESYPDFTIENFGDYELHGHKYKGYFGGVSFPNMQQAYAYIVFNPYATVPPINDQAYWDTHSGSKMLVTTFSLKNDDWIIRPVEGGGTLSFYAAGAQFSGSVAEKFQVLYSVTDNNPANFINAGERDYQLTTRNWEKYEFKLPENARYFAIHCITEDGSMFKIDDLNYTLNHGSAVEKPIGYQVFLNGEKLKDLKADETSYQWENMPNGKNTLGIKAVYQNGVSEMEEREIVVGRIITAPVNLQVKNTDTGWLFTWNMPGQESAQYYKVFLDGNFVINTMYKEYLFRDITDQNKHIAGVCAVVNEYFSDTIYIEFNATAVEEGLSLQTPSVYPNPSRGEFYFELPENGLLEIYNLQGKRLYQEYKTAGEHIIHLSAQPKGIYIYRLETEKATFSGKIMIQ